MSSEEARKVKQVEVGIVPEGWIVRKIGECCELERKQFLPSKEDIRPYIGLEHIKQQSLRLLSVGSSEEVESNKFEFKSGHILFGKLRPYFRKVYLPKFDGVCSTDIWVISVKEPNHNIFFFYFFADKRIIDEANNSSEGTRMPRAKWDYLKELEYAIPQPKEQRASAKILSDLDAKIELNQQMNKTLAAIGQAIFKRWFVDFEFPNEEGKPYKSSGGQMDSSDFREKPHGWSTKPFSEVIAVNPPRKIGKNAIAKKAEMSDLNPWQPWVESWSTDNYKSGSRFQNGDTLFARITPCLENGKTAFVSFLNENEVAFGSTEFIVLGPKTIRSSYYILYLAINKELRALAILSMSGSSGRQRVPNDFFDDFVVAVPPDELSRKFDSLVAPMFEKITNNTNESRSLKAIRDNLLPRLMSGKIRVPVPKENVAVQ